MKSIETLFVKSLCVLGIASIIFATNSILPPSSYAAPPLAQPPGTGIAQGNDKVIQPFELTNPAATRSEAYDDIAKLNVRIQVKNDRRGEIC